MAATEGLPAAPSAAPAGQRVLAVDVTGTRAVATETCLAKIQTRPGVPYMDSVVSEDIRRLYALGYFTDVRVETESLPEGVRVVFVVQEKPVIQKIEIEGNRHLTHERILKLLGVKVGDLYDPRQLKEGVDQIKAAYARKGYSRVEAATSATVDATANATTVYLVVDEGPRMRVTQIFVEGNLAFSDRQILRLLKTKRRGLFSAGVYDPKVLEEDLERVRSFYRQHGYQDIAVTSDVAADPSGASLYVRLQLVEGLQHRIGSVTIAGTVLFPEHELRQLISLKPGAVYTTEALQDDLRAMKQYYGDRGYIKAEVTPETALDETTKRVDLTYRIAENELIYVNRIEVRGNLQTKDVVIRRELRILPGEPFNGQHIRRSIERLYNLGFFEEVNVNTQPVSRPNREDLVLEVKEAKTGSFSFGGGFSSVDRLVGLVELEQRNFDLRNFPTFTGAGQDLRLRAEVGTVRRYFDLSFTEPWFLGHPLSFGLDAFDRTRLRSESLGLGYKEERIGGGLRFGKELTDTLKLDWGYQLYRTTISEVSDNASADLKAEAGRNNISEGSVSLAWDRRDNRFDPTRGFYVFSSADLAGGLLAGNKDFVRLQAGASGYLPHLSRCVLEARLRTGLVDAFGNSTEVPIFERFFAGGADTIRGFRERRVGPRDPSSNDPIGGEAILTGTLEEVVTLYNDERGRPILKGSVFYDAGDVWRRVNQFGESLKSGVGIGTRITTPIGPVRLDMGYPLNPDADEKRKLRFHFNISRSF